jgi:hypothetical protein
MGTASSRNLFWAFVRYLKDDMPVDVPDLIKKATAYATVNTDELNTYDDALYTTSTAYTDVQLPGVTGEDLNTATTLATKEAIFKRVIKPGHDIAVADIRVDHRLPLYGL